MSLPDESSRVAASSLLARLGIIVCEREIAYLYEMQWQPAIPLGGRMTWRTYMRAPALETARKFNSSIR